MLRTHIIPRVAAFAMKRAAVQRAAFHTLSQIGIRYRESPLSQTLSGIPADAPRAGDRFPWLRLKFDPQTPREDLFQRLDDTRFNLLVIGQPAPSTASLPLGGAQVHVVQPGAENDAALAAASIPNPSYYLLRPDGHIGLAGTSLQEADIRQWLARAHLRLESGAPEHAKMAG